MRIVTIARVIDDRVGGISLWLNCINGKRLSFLAVNSSAMLEITEIDNYHARVSIKTRTANYSRIIGYGDILMYYAKQLRRAIKNSSI